MKKEDIRKAFDNINPDPSLYDRIKENIVMLEAEDKTIKKERRFRFPSVSKPLAAACLCVVIVGGAAAALINATRSNDLFVYNSTADGSLSCNKNALADSMNYDNSFAAAGDASAEGSKNVRPAGSQAESCAEEAGASHPAYESQDEGDIPKSESIALEAVYINGESINFAVNTGQLYSLDNYSFESIIDTEKTYAVSLDFFVITSKNSENLNYLDAEHESVKFLKGSDIIARIESGEKIYIVALK